MPLVEYTLIPEDGTQVSEVRYLETDTNATVAIKRTGDLKHTDYHPNGGPVSVVGTPDGAQATISDESFDLQPGSLVAVGLTQEGGFFVPQARLQVTPADRAIVSK